MRRFFFLSLFLHGIVLMLLFSWKIPEAGKLSARNIIQVSLIEKGEDETPLPKAEKAAEKRKVEKRIEKKGPPPLLDPKETAKEIGKEDSKEEKIQKEEETRVEPDSPPNQSGPLPGPLLAEVSQPLGNRAVEDAKGVGEEKKKPEAPGGGEVFLAGSLNPGAGKEGIPSGGGEQQARVLGGDGGTSERNPTGPSLSAVDPILLKIMRRIEEAKRYPKAARRMGIEGKTVVRFKLKPAGQVEVVEVAESSGSDILDKASVETVREAAPLPYKEGWLKVGIVFKIL
jgi:TonB family protein